jgi:DNA-binding transcriptional regulator YhcF (GntR family)
MSTYHWIKLYDEILDDPKMGRLSDGAYRLCINVFLLANRSDERDGRLPDFEDMAWALRISQDDLQKYWQELERAEIVCMVDGMPMVTKFAERQTTPVPVAERVRAHRGRKKQEETENNADETASAGDSNDDVTQRYQNKKEDKDKDHSLSANADAPADSREEIDVYVDDLLAKWGELFPKKPQPRRQTYRSKIKTRIKSAHFRDNWLTAMNTAAQSMTLQIESWFSFEFFVRNDENYVKCLNNWMGWKDEQLKAKATTNGRSPSTSNGTADDSAVWDLVLAHARRGDANFKDQALRAAVIAFGWPKLQRIPTGEENFYRKDFMRIYHEQSTATPA